MRDVREVVREEPAMRGRILAALGSGPSTVPEIAAAVGLPEPEVMFWVMGMRKYGYVVERKEVEDGYFRYEAVERSSA